MLKLSRLGSAAVAMSVMATAAGAAGVDDGRGFPSKPMRIIVGPGPDIVGRLVGQKLTEAWGQQVIVETRPGGGGNIAGEMVAKATPDGYTLLLASAAYTINAALQPGSFDLVKDFAPVVFCATAPFVLAVHPSVAARTVQELVALAKAKPGVLIYASSGNGTPPHLAGESKARLSIAAASRRQSKAEHRRISPATKTWLSFADASSRPLSTAM